MNTLQKKKVRRRLRFYRDKRKGYWLYFEFRISYPNSETEYWAHMEIGPFGGIAFTRTFVENLGFHYDYPTKLLPIGPPTNMEIVKFLKEGEACPKWYGLAYRDFGNDVYVLYPIPINLIVVGIRWLQMKMRWEWPRKLTGWEGLVRHSFKNGYQAGLIDGEENVKNAYKFDIPEVYPSSLHTPGPKSTDPSLSTEYLIAKMEEFKAKEVKIEAQLMQQGKMQIMDAADHVHFGPSSEVNVIGMAKDSGKLIQWTDQKVIDDVKAQMEQLDKIKSKKVDIGWSAIEELKKSDEF